MAYRQGRACSARIPVYHRLIAAIRAAAAAVGALARSGWSDEV
jgi:hypothetical protein